MGGWSSSRTVSGAPPFRCRGSSITFTATCSSQTRAGRSSTRVWARRARVSSGRPSSLPSTARFARIVVTHFHPDHIGSAAYLGELTGAPVNQGAVDHATAKRVWGDPDWPDRLSRWYALHGLESELAENFLGDASRLRDNVSWPREPEIVEPGDRIAAAGEEWEFAPMPGHADGQLVLFGTRHGAPHRRRPHPYAHHAEHRPPPRDERRSARRLHPLARLGGRAFRRPRPTAATTSPSRTRSRVPSRSRSTTQSALTTPSTS